MSKYDEMSDFEINTAVAEHLPVIIHENQSASLKVSSSGVLCNDIVNQYELNFCNNPNDAWPIIVESKITTIDLIDEHLAVANLEFLDSEHCDGVIGDWTHEHRDKKPLRAAMIVFLMMKEGE